MSSVLGTSNAVKMGFQANVEGAGTGDKIGFHNITPITAGGTHYGIYSSVLKAGANNFAGYFLGNVGIGTAIGNTYTLPPFRGANGQVMTTDGAGNVTWQIPAALTNWSLTGNAITGGGNTTTAGTNFIGTTSNQNLDFRTNNIYRGRFTAAGEFFVGTLNTATAGDLMSAVSNATFPFAINGYSSQNGSGVYGAVSGGTAAFGAVQGEYFGTAATGTGVRGINASGVSGTGYAAAGSGVDGRAQTGGAYKFGVYGFGGQSQRSGGVIGTDYNVVYGALGYWASNNGDYSVYGFGQAYTPGAAAGRGLSQPNTHIGLGIYGGVMGGWVRGQQFGFHAKGETYSLYVDGDTYVNKPVAHLIDNGQTKTAAYMSTALSPEISSSGKTNLQGGKIFVAFEKSFSDVMANPDDLIITATPQGRSNGIYIDGITKNGFWIYENNDGVSNVKISWIAISKIVGEENPEVPRELVARDFDKKMDGVMHNEIDTSKNAQPLWHDGQNIRWDQPNRTRSVDTSAMRVHPKK